MLREGKTTWVCVHCRKLIKKDTVDFIHVTTEYYACVNKNGNLIPFQYAHPASVKCAEVACRAKA